MKQHLSGVLAAALDGAAFVAVRAVTADATHIVGVGITSSASFPTTPSAFQKTYTGGK